MIARPAPDPQLPSCCRELHEEIHECICMTVACAYCGKKHPPHRPCPKDKEEPR